MQGHDRTRKGLRPRHKSAAAHAGGDCHDQADGTPARLFLCQGCRVQVLICSHCDRGHNLLRQGLCSESAPPLAARRRSPLPDEPSRPPQSCGAITPPPGAQK